MLAAEQAFEGQAGAPVALEFEAAAGEAVAAHEALHRGDGKRAKASACSRARSISHRRRQSRWPHEPLASSPRAMQPEIVGSGCSTPSMAIQPGGVSDGR